MDRVSNGVISLTDMVGVSARTVTAQGFVQLAPLSDTFGVTRGSGSGTYDDEQSAAHVIDALDIDESSAMSLSVRKSKQATGKPKPGTKPKPKPSPAPKPKPGPKPTPKPGGSIFGQIGKGLGTGAAIFNGICGIAIISIADDLQNQTGPPSCKDVCAAIEIYMDIIKNGSIVTGLANLVGCKTALELMSFGCGCK